MTNRTSRFPLQWWLRVFVSVVVLGIVFAMLPTEEIWITLQLISLRVWTTCLGLYVTVHMIAALKWRFLIRHATKMSPAIAIRAHFAGLVANLCLPGMAGGDVVRAGIAIRGASDSAGVVIGSLADRLIDMFALLVVGLLGVQLTAGSTVDAADVLAKFAVALVTIPVAVMVGVSVASRVRLPVKMQRLVGKIAGAVAGILRHPWRPLAAFGLALCVQSTLIALNVYLAERSGLELPRSAWFFAWPVAKLVAMIPISVAGLGVREATLAAILAPMGANAVKVVAVGLVWQTILIAGGLVGGISLLLFRRPTSSGTGAVVARSGPPTST